MTEERFEDLFKGEEVTAPKLTPGDLVTAKVVGISGDHIFLDIGGKSEGVVAAAELTDEEGNITVCPGDNLQVYFLSMRSGSMIFTTKIGAGQASLQELEDAYRSGIPVQGRVVGEIKGGFNVKVAGQRAFCPYSQMDIRRIEDPGEYLENQYQFKIIEFAGNGRNIILSARAILEEERERQRRDLEKNLAEGSRVKGTVTSIRDFGAFVDIGGIDGLIPISELAWGQVERVDDVLTRGQEVEVIVTRLDWDKERITLSLKSTLENPWDKVGEKYGIGTIHTGTISRLTQFGAFVTLEPGIDGLIHISKLGSGRRINHPREVVEQGQEITVRIENVDRDNKRIALVPEDFPAEKDMEKKSTKNHDVPSMPTQNKSLGTLGDLLSETLKKKK